MFSEMVSTWSKLKSRPTTRSRARRGRSRRPGTGRGAAEVPANPMPSAGRAHRLSSAPNICARSDGGPLSREGECHRKAYRGWARSDDRRPVREFPHLPSHHHLGAMSSRAQSLLRHIIGSRSDLCGPEPGRSRRRSVPPMVSRSRRPWRELQPGPRATNARPSAAPTRATPFQPAPERAGEERKPEGSAEGEFETERYGNTLSLATIEAELKPKVVETFDNIAETYKRCVASRIRISRTSLRNDSLSPRTGAQVQEAQGTRSSAK